MVNFLLLSTLLRNDGIKSDWRGNWKKFFRIGQFFGKISTVSKWSVRGGKFFKCSSIFLDNFCGTVASIHELTARVVLAVCEAKNQSWARSSRASVVGCLLLPQFALPPTRLFLLFSRFPLSAVFFSAQPCSFPSLFSRCVLRMYYFLNPSISFSLSSKFTIACVN